MATFAYTAKNLSGKEMTGTRDARDKFDLAKSLRDQGYTLVFANEIKKGASGSFFSLSLFDRVSVSEKMIFARNISVMIGAGLALARALEILSEQTKSKKFKNTIKALVEDIKKGQFLSDAMLKHPDVFSKLFVSMVKAGEEGGNLTESFNIVSKQLEREYELKRKVRGAMIYPAIIFTAMIVIGILMLMYVVPTLVSTFEELDIDLPPSTQFIISMSNFISSSTTLFLLSVAAFIAFFVWFFRTDFGRKITGAAFFRLPVIKPLIQKINSARTARTMGSLVTSGVDILRAIEITEDVIQNQRFKSVLREARTKIQKGDSLSSVFKAHTNLYPMLVGEMIAVGEETGKLSDMLFRLADFYEGDVAESTKDLSTIIEPVMMIIIGVAVGFFAISMISPLYSSLSGI